MTTHPKPKKVLVIGSGPIVIGQAAEFDYAGTQACKALREEGVATVLVNSNPATIMTDEGIADVVYIEPLTVEVIERIIAAERPDGLLATLGGQTGLNLAMALHEAGVLERYGVRPLGTPIETIRTAEDRELFRDMLKRIGEPTPESEVVSDEAAGMAVGRKLGLPLVVRPAYTLGGTGGGFATTMEELATVVRSGLAASPIGQVLVERSLAGWREIEYEVIRDGADTCITICNMENLDAMGVHTGDSIVIAPSQTLSDKEYQMLRSASIRIIRALGVEGGCNVQFALAPHPVIGETLPGGAPEPMSYHVIEVNPRVSRSSALASKATGYPIARVAAKIAVGKLLHEIPNAVTQKTSAAFEPALDYCVIKIPRWPFDKFATADRETGTQMKATGEVMAIDRSFEAALQKAVRSLEIDGRSLRWEDPAWEGMAAADLPLHPTDFRLWALAAALRRGMSVDELAKTALVEPWFLSGIERIVAMERRLAAENLTHDLLWDAKRMGMPDGVIAELTGRTAEEARELRTGMGIRPVYKMVDTCAAEFEAVTPYFYSTYESENEAEPLPAPRALVIGSGPIRIGQGIEFDYCSVHAAWALHAAGVRSIMVNSNPETVSTDFDTSDRLYFEPLDEEAVRDILENETIEGDGAPDHPASVVQFGGQTAINLSQAIEKAGLPILGSSADTIDTASNRERFGELMSRLGVPQPPGETVTSVDRGMEVASRLGFPVLVRPSYVLGGRAMEIVDNMVELVRYLTVAMEAAPGRPTLIDKYFEGREVEVDAVVDGTEVLIPGIMEHIERAGVHSGDSMAVYPAATLTASERDTIVDYTTRIGLGLGVRGLMNVQYVIMNESRPWGLTVPVDAGLSSVYVIEVNPRSSRTVPFISKVTDIPMVALATNVMLGRSLKEQGYSGGLQPEPPMVSVKAPVFSMSKLRGVDTYLGPEMKSTGEVMGIDTELRPAIAKALEAAGLMLPPAGALLITIADRDKAEAVPWLKLLGEQGYRLYATAGTAALIRRLGLEVTEVAKVGEPEPNSYSVVADGTVVGVVNTVAEVAVAMRDGFEIRRAATERGIPCYTSMDTARAAIEAVVYGKGEYHVAPTVDYVRGNVKTGGGVRAAGTMESR
ncbi:MAG: carbamoyl-phosphate synthase large subunit [Chloroflexi bacterium]|nr:carbamoyl-phosphate synthase large subunit [Chloroflexota bacterium]MCH7656616.1 carbamoyl-phosphate synthase large subunit [Chloroflexota bacterium]